MTEYYNLDHAQMRLNDCVVKLDDKFVIILRVDKGAKLRNNYKIAYANLADPSGELLVGSIPQQEINCKDLRLGFVNDYGRKLSYYSRRIPIRAYKINLSECKNV